MKKNLLLFAMLISSSVSIAQPKDLIDWHLKDSSEGYRGISLQKAYTLLKGKKSTTIIVAVLDSGIDTTHEDLAPVLWSNPNEIPGNGIDDDKNGYIDDMHGWSFRDTTRKPKNYDSILFARGALKGSDDIGDNISNHGTHVSGVIAAVRNNAMGGDGIADNVRIMMVRVSRYKRSSDYSIAAGIRYAVDNGAMILNISLGNDISSDKQVMDEAVSYAMKKGVLIVQSSGNEQSNIDVTPNYPSPVYADSTRAAGWITVGASNSGLNGHPKMHYSNWGKKMVDVFAPGTFIYSCIPGKGNYEFAEGTSEAAPIVSGIAALIWSYFPHLTNVQVKEIIGQSVIPDQRLQRFCKTGGIVNAYNAILLAESYLSYK